MGLGLNVGDEMTANVSVVQVVDVPNGDIFNPVDVGSSRAIAYMIGENRAKKRYSKMVAVNVNTRQRTESAEVEVATTETPLKVSALEGDVYIAIDDTGESVELPDGVQINDESTPREVIVDPGE